MRDYPWLGEYRPWGVSPISLLEIQYLSEVDRLRVRNPEFSDLVISDARFVVDDVPLHAMVRHALPMTWTRDPFDRLLAAHSGARRVPLCTVDHRILANHSLIPYELRN